MAAGSLDAEFKLSTAPLAGGGRPLARALAVSIVLHLLLLVFWIGVERRDPARPPPELVAIPLELIAPPPVPTPAPPPPPAPPLAERPPPPPPQLREGAAAERSTPPPAETPPAATPPAPPPPTQSAARAAPRAEPAPRAAAPPAPRTAEPGPAPPAPAPAPTPAAPVARANPQGVANVGAPPRSNVERNAERPPAGLPSERVTQSETDYLLAQIVRNWLLDYRNPRFADVILRFWFVLEPDGRIPPPLGGDGPIDFAQMVVNYPELVRASQIDPRYRDMRTALETFIVAVRASLPLAPQPDAPRAAGQRSMLIEFKLGDLAR